MVLIFSCSSQNRSPGAGTSASRVPSHPLHPLPAPSSTLEKQQQPGPRQQQPYQQQQQDRRICAQLKRGPLWPRSQPTSQLLPPLLLFLLSTLLLPAPGSASKVLSLELDMRQLRQAEASTGFAGNPTATTTTSTSTTATTTTTSTGAGASTAASGPIWSGNVTHAGNHYELPGSPQELTDCINRYQPDSNGTSWASAMRDEHPYFRVVGMWWSRKPADVPLTITTQLSWNRKWQLKAMCRSWAGPIAAVMHMPVLLPRLTRRRQAVLSDVSNATLQRAVDLVAAFHERMDRQHSCKLDLMLLAEPYKDGKSLVLYPVNTMRNYARLMARTPLIGLVDVDLIVSSNLRTELLDPGAAARYMAEAAAAVAAASEGRRGANYSTGWSRRANAGEVADQLNLTTRPDGPRAAYVLPAFVTRGGSLQAQVERAEKLTNVSKKELLPYYKEGKILRFDWGSTGHQNTNYGAWFASSEPYLVQWADRYEPWVFVDRLTSSWADSRFRGYGKNKIIHIRTLAYEGYELRVHPAAFLIHRPHLQSSSSNAHLRSAQYGKKSKSSSMYGHNLHLYNGVQRSMAYGKYVPEVDPATEVCRRELSWWREAPVR